MGLLATLCGRDLTRNGSYATASLNEGEVQGSASTMERVKIKVVVKVVHLNLFL